jgi:hypothetical protein
MSTFPLSYRVQGEDDYMLEITIDAAGAFVVNSGDHTSHEPRNGTLSHAKRARIEALSDALGGTREHPVPAGASAIVANLDLGEGTVARHYRFWEGALDADAPLKALVRELEVL